MIHLLIDELYKKVTLDKQKQFEQFKKEVSKANDEGKLNKYRRVLVDWCEFEGPYIETWPPKVREKYLGSDKSKSNLSLRARTAIKTFASPLEKISKTFSGLNFPRNSHQAPIHKAQLKILIIP